MLRYFFSNEETSKRFDPLIDRVVERMHEVGVDSPEYQTLLTHLERLNELKGTEAQPPVSRDTLALCICNLAGILLIVAYEQKHVMTSKGFSQIIRPR